MATTILRIPRARTSPQRKFFTNFLNVFLRGAEIRRRVSLFCTHFWNPFSNITRTNRCAARPTQR